jgi:hypothetical protein
MENQGQSRLRFISPELKPDSWLKELRACRADVGCKRNRGLIIPPRAAILMCSGLRRDALALVKQFPVEG